MYSWYRGMGVQALTGMVVVAVLLAGAEPAVCQKQSWEDAWKVIDRTYYREDKKLEAVVDIGVKIEELGNRFSDDIMYNMLEILKEYYGVVDPDLNEFRGIIYSMFQGASRQRITNVVQYFKGAPELYQTANDARRAYFTPQRVQLKLNRSQINVDETTGYTIRAYNNEEYEIDARSEFDVTVDDRFVARVENGAIQGVGKGETNVVVSDSQGRITASVKLEVLAGLFLAIDPSVQKTTVNDVTEFKITANRSLDTLDLHYDIEPPGMADFREHATQPGSTERQLDVTAKKASHDVVKLHVWGPDSSYTFAQMFIKPVDPEIYKPSKTWPIISTSVTAAFLVGAFVTQGQANSLYDEEQAIRSEGGTQADIDAKHAEYSSKQDTGNILWGVTAVAAVATGYIWYRYYGKTQEYKRRVEEYKEYARYQIEIDPAGTIALNVRF